MERVKVLFLGVIAAVLCFQLLDRAIPEAHAQTGDIACNAWHNEMMGALKGEEKVIASSMAYANDVRTWLLAHPGDTAFRTTLLQAGGSYVDIVCVRSP
jgi:hypothetical protein